jgi:hypothetical protein
LHSYNFIFEVLGDIFIPLRQVIFQLPKTDEKADKGGNKKQKQN